MIDFAKTVRIACLAMLGMTSIGYAQQPGQSDMSKMPGTSGGQMQGMGGQGMGGQGMSGQGMGGQGMGGQGMGGQGMGGQGMRGMNMQGMGGQGMGGMKMQGMMKRCAQMHQKMSDGKAMSSKMHKMMAQCDQMDHGMKTDAPAPSATQDR
jgi:hypothetical protein